MKHSISIPTLTLLLGSFFLFQACNSPSGTNPSDTPAAAISETLDISTIEAEPIDDLETASLLYMREEEKLARDVYLTLNEQWDKKVFTNISESEQRHMDAIKLLLDRYDLDDPAEGQPVGTFTNPDLQQLYDLFIEQGSASLVEAYTVGATIEETDLVDIQDALDNEVDNEDIIMVYEHLKAASANHLKAFVRNLDKQGVTYEPQFLSQEDYDTYIK